ncbi:hypothetical protein [Prosthecobacter sp.]
MKSYVMAGQTRAEGPQESVQGAAQQGLGLVRMNTFTPKDAL